MIGIEINYLDGTKDWFDPVDEEEYKSVENDKNYVFYVGSYKYEIERKLVSYIREYELCEVYGYEKVFCNCKEQDNA
ncbi:MAG: hypothetical protein ACM31M_09625 [Nitrososphaerota archaeon]